MFDTLVKSAGLGTKVVVVAVAILVVVLACVVAYIADWATVKKLLKIRSLLWICILFLQGFALYVTFRDTTYFQVPTAVSVLGWLFFVVFAFLLFYSLVLELPRRNTYYGHGSPRRLMRTGTYALTRHPGVIWYILALASLVLATRSALLLLVAPVWSLANIIYTVIQDQKWLPRIFPEYEQYQRETPMLIPTLRSIRACFRTLSVRDNIIV